MPQPPGHELPRSLCYGCSGSAGQQCCFARQGAARPDWSAALALAGEELGKPVERLRPAVPVKRASCVGLEGTLHQTHPGRRRSVGRRAPRSSPGRPRRPAPIRSRRQGAMGEPGQRRPSARRPRPRAVACDPVPRARVGGDLDGRDAEAPRAPPPREPGGVGEARVDARMRCRRHTRQLERQPRWPHGVIVCRAGQARASLRAMSSSPRASGLAAARASKGSLACRTRFRRGSVG